MTNLEINLEIKGFSDGNQFRKSNEYETTQELFGRLGLTDEVENRTPTVGVNIAHLAQMGSIQSLRLEIEGRDLSVAILGISIAQGPSDFQRLLKSLGAGKVKTTAIDLSDGIFSEIKMTGLDEVLCLLRDARDTGLEPESQDFILRDHLGNCCPPVIDRQIDEEAFRILKPGGISIVNITTSELLEESERRRIVNFREAVDMLGLGVVKRLQTDIYDLKQLKETFPEIDKELLRDLIIEIEPEGSFVVFGEDQQGHGEWFRIFEDHKKTWEEHGFEIVEIATRRGKDSHKPPLECLRHNVVLRKKNIS